ncbi:uncharacterized protein DUF4892 [Sinobacterium caligoides]|uniref:Uncharacterized protein DUF4892 n=1 Tax=Sinobacterium caligoides TaxID=933926 RepID=A0A3N2DMG9_9GAMM|nr:DUF4892 domain-containing protein [Sinobacterium caligoides]ROS00998.1 uncharacterized protein DUF4892 [Sinobacterium caligoides]
MISQHVFKLFCIAISLLSFSAIAGDIEGSKDNPLLERYPRSVIVHYNQRSDDEVWLLKSAIQTVNGGLRARTADLLIGDAEDISYRLPTSHTAEDAYRSFEASAVLLGGERIYQCQGRGCGSSVDWANEVFGYSMLYGPDRGQFYSLFQLPKQVDHDRYIAIYAVTRGNGKAYINLQFINGSIEERDVRWNGR